MAKTPEKAAGQKPVKKKTAVRRRKKSEGSGVLPLLVLGLLVLALINYYMAMLFLFFLVPTFVLAFTGQDAYHGDRLLTVMMMNLAGILPFAMQIYRQPDAFEYIVFDMVKIATMLGAAAAGYLLLWIGPMIAAIILQALSQDRLQKIAAQRKELLELYGPEVLSDGTGET